MPPIEGINSLTMARETRMTEKQQGQTLAKISFVDALQKATSKTPNNISTGESRHIPLMGSTLAVEDFEEQALEIRAYRQQLIASNIANADTPNYKAVDIDFRESMKNALNAMGSSLALATTASKHIPIRAGETLQTSAIKYYVPSQASLDGNTVETEVEQAKSAENMVMYEFSLYRVKEEYKDMLDLLKNLK